ncbi:MAG: alanine racemase [Candidatus Latescibacterota bacterium]
MIEHGEYRVAEPDSIQTPAMLVFAEALDHNIRAACEVAGGGQRLLMHVKTHKSAAVARRQLEAGVAGFKCATLRELEMVLEAGAPQALLAYPLAQQSKAEWFAGLAAAHAQARVCAVASAPAHLEVLGQVAQSRSQTLHVMVDLDAGMHRTGIGVEGGAGDLYRALAATRCLEPAGLHVYDGHEHFSDPQARRAAALAHIGQVQAFAAALQADGLPVPCVVGGGSFSFPYYARTEGMYGSPGTCVYWDTGYSSAMPDMPFRWAAMVLTQVVDRYPEQKTLTTDLGYKAIATDPPLHLRAHLLGHAEAELHLQNEEHGVLRWPGEMPPVGAYLLAVPGHVCPTTVHYPGCYVVDGEGQVVDYFPHTARDR